MPAKCLNKTGGYSSKSGASTYRRVLLSQRVLLCNKSMKNFSSLLPPLPRILKWVKVPCQKRMLRYNKRGAKEMFFSGEQRTIDSLKGVEDLPCEGYIRNSIHFDQLGQVEFHISKVAHVTIKSGLDGILDSGGFQGSHEEDLLWFGMVIEDNDIQNAEERYLEKSFPGRSDQQKTMQKPFLAGLTTSPAFEMDKSRYGNFKFTFSLQDMLQLYKEQICGGDSPVMRVYGTTVYKQEIMYAVIVHSPSVKKYEEYPGLCEDDAVCTFTNQSIVWQAQALANEIYWQPVTNGDEIIELEKVRHTFYVWDHVNLAFHVPKGQKLELSRERLIQNLSACEASDPFIGGKCGMMRCICGHCRLLLPDAQSIVDQYKVQEGQEQTR